MGLEWWWWLRGLLSAPWGWMWLCRVRKGQEHRGVCSGLQEMCFVQDQALELCSAPQHHSLT